MKTIYIHGDIDLESFSDFSKELEEIPTDEPISIELISSGGDAESALAYYDLIRCSPHKFYIDGYGIIASAATIILAAGDNRRMGSNAYFMIHEEEISLKKRSVTYSEGYLKHCRRVENQWSLLLASRSKASIAWWSTYSEKETYLSAEECLSLGIIDSIIKEKT